MKKPFEWTDLPLWAFLALLAFIPWPLGGFSPWAIQVLLLASSGITITYFLLKIFLRPGPLPPALFLFSIFALMAQGWFMTLNSEFVPTRATDLLLPVNRLLAHLPGSLNRNASLECLGRVIPLLAVAWMCADASRGSTWRKRIIITMALTGTAVVTFGILEKIAGPHRYWTEYGHNVWPFASFYYHANAGAFINLILPLVAALAWRASFIDTSPWPRSLWISALVLAIAGGFVNASKGALVVLIMIILMIGIVTFRALGKIKSTRHNIPVVLLMIVLLGGMVSLLAISADMQQSLSRWSQAYEMRDVIAAGRLQVATICLKLSHEAGYLGFGPGTFESVFPYAAALYSGAPSGHWRFAHQDYLQTLVEWGKIGLMFWGILYFGGILSALYHGMSTRNGFRQRDKFLLLCLAVSLLGCAVHALIDFPLQVPSIQLYVAALLGIAWGSWQWPHDPVSPEPVKTEAPHKKKKRRHHFRLRE